jgi:translation initiation factor IF-2
MNPDRPFSGPVSVSVAGLSLLAIAAWSFTSGLTRELRLTRSGSSAQVATIQPPKPVPAAPRISPPPAASAPDELAEAADAPQEPAPAPAHRAHRHEIPVLPALPPLTAEAAQEASPPPTAPAATSDGTDAAAEVPPSAPPRDAEPPT